MSNDYTDTIRQAMARTVRRHFRPVPPQTADNPTDSGKPYMLYSCFKFALDRTNFLDLAEARIFGQELLAHIDEIEAEGRNAGQIEPEQ